MKQVLSYIAIIIIFLSVGWIANDAYKLVTKEDDPLGIKIKPTPVPTPLTQYAIENLATKEFKPSEIVLGEIVKESKPTDESNGFLSKKFFFNVDTPQGIKKVSGLINTPLGSGTFPIIVMFRGFVAQEIYSTGMGTKNSAEFFAHNGFITVAPDFLGYGESDKESEDIFETRFQTYLTAATLLGSIKDFPLPMWDKKNIFIWGHSNGGQVALTTLEITGLDSPTVLWAPVSKPFPYSILYYTDEAEDGGKFLRHELANFEKTYDTDKYSLVNYLDRIKAPIQLNQGTLDEAIPTNWSDNLAKKLKELDINIEYIKYSGTDHNMNPKWDEVINNSMLFYKSQLIR